MLAVVDVPCEERVWDDKEHEYIVRITPTETHSVGDVLFPAGKAAAFVDQDAVLQKLNIALHFALRQAAQAAPGGEPARCAAAARS